jgi:hypothetical protein
MPSKSSIWRIFMAYSLSVSSGFVTMRVMQLIVPSSMQPMTMWVLPTSMASIIYINPFGALEYSDIIASPEQSQQNGPHTQ